jgi:Tfp pilus assembly protein PilX
MERRDHQRERGAAMFIAVLLLILMGALGLVALDTATEDRRIAGFQNRSASAFAAAEAGIAHAAELAKQNVTNLPTQNLSDATVYDREGGALPSYRADPNPLPVGTNPTGIVSAGFGAAEGVAPDAGGGWKTGKWRINVEGRSPVNAAGMDGRMSTSRVELMWGEPTHAGSDYEGQ